MTNFKIKNNLKVKNAKLVDATAYQDENGYWYMELQYEYEDESGAHRRYYPKVEFPLTGQIISDVCVIDNLIKPAVHEMTIEEIEKKLGYKIKIVNKENSNES